MSGSDFNDMAVTDGAEALRLAVAGAVPPLRPIAIDLRRASEIHCIPIRWLWPGYLARGKLHILAGAPGTGKTTIALALAASVSCGGRWPSGTTAPTGNVLVWSGEDDAADTLVPRLRAAGADLTRVYFVGDTLDDGEPRAFDPATDLAILEAEADRIGDIALLIADPVVSAVAGDSHKNTEVRRALQPLVNLGARLGCAVLGVTHFSKGTAGRDPTERVTGSVAFGAIARVVLVTAKNQDDGADGSRLMARAKSNIGPDGGGFAYLLEQIDIGGIEASRVLWGSPLDGSARELLGDAEEVGRDSNRDDAADWLRDLLSMESMPVKAVKAEASGAGISWRTVERAKSDLGVVAARVSSGNDGRGRWEWALPGNTATSKTANPNSQDWRSCGEQAAVRLRGVDLGATPPSLKVDGVAADLPTGWESEA